MSERRGRYGVGARAFGAKTLRNRKPDSHSRVQIQDRLKVAFQSGPVRTLSDEERRKYEQELLQRDVGPAKAEEET